MATKEKKNDVVKELTQFFAEAKVAVVADLSGLTVAELTRLRRKLDSDKAKCRIAKNTLVKIATKAGSFAELEKLAQGPSAFIVGYQEPAQAAKITVDYLKNLKKGSIRGGVLDGKILTADEVKGLAELPSKEQLLAGIMGGLNSGAQGLVDCLARVIGDLAILIEQVAKKNQDGKAASVADKRIEKLKELKESTELGLQEAKDLVDSAPKPLKEE